MPPRLWLTSALIALVACSASDAIAPLPPDELRAAPLVITITGQTLSLEPTLWRDFQPSSPPNGKPLVALLRVRSTDSTALKATVHVDAVWIANGSETWSSAAGEEYVAPGRAFYQAVARDGPKWSPGDRVDVVVRIREASSAPQLLRAAGQLILRTD